MARKLNQVLGLDQLAGAFAQAAVETQAEAMVRADKAADQIVETAQTLVPIGATGHLHDSIRKEPATPTSISVVAADGDAWYGTFVEFGTSKMAARPFFRPAIDSVTEDL